MKSAKERIKKIFKNTDADSILLFNSDREDSNFIYLTDFKGGTFEYTPLLITKDSMTLFASSLEYGIAKSGKPKEMEIELITSGDQLKKQLGEAFKGKVVGLNWEFIPYRLYNVIEKIKPKPKKIVDVSKAFGMARITKEKIEIEKIARAVKITKKAIELTKEDLRLGMTEEEAASVVDKHILDQGAQVGFSSIVSFGANTALPHHSPGSTKLARNSIVLFDIGARYKNYFGDITRTSIFKPDLKSEKYRRYSEIYSVVEKAQEMALRSMKEGTLAATPHNIAAKYIDTYKDGKYKGRFIHSLGHSIGIDVHDGAVMAPKSKLRLKENMVFSDEPGIYIEGAGGVRIEDDVLIGKKSSHFF